MNTNVLTLSAQVADCLRADRLHRAFSSHALDGSECHHAIDLELRGLENAEAAAKIKRAISVQYGDTVAVHVVIEIVCRLLETEELS
jgi:hypothetical protein